MLKPLTERLHSELQSLPQRDRLALYGLILFCAGVVLLYGLWRPVQHFHQQARDEFASQRELYAWLQAQEVIIAGTPQAPSRSTTTAGSSPLTIVNSTARELELAIKRVQPENNGDLRLWLENITFDTALRWLQQLESKGLTIRDLQADRLQPGLVNLQVTLAPAIRR